MKLHSHILQTKKYFVAMSSCKAKYITVSFCLCHAIWLRRLFQNLHMLKNNKIKLFYQDK